MTDMQLAATTASDRVDVLGIHVSATNLDDTVETFARWIETLVRVPRLVILGDLFDVWVGPAQERMPGAPRVLDALRALVARGTAVAIVSRGSPRNSRVRPPAIVPPERGRRPPRDRPAAC